MRRGGELISALNCSGDSRDGWLAVGRAEAAVGSSGSRNSIRVLGSDAQRSAAIQHCGRRALGLLYSQRSGEQEGWLKGAY